MWTLDLCPEYKKQSAHIIHCVTAKYIWIFDVKELWWWLPPYRFFVILLQIALSHKLFSSKAVYLFLRLILVTFSYSRVIWLQDMRSTVGEGQAIARDNRFLQQKNYKTAKQYSFHSQQTSGKEKAQVLKRFHKTSSLIKSMR